MNIYATERINYPSLSANFGRYFGFGMSWITLTERPGLGYLVARVTFNRLFAIIYLNFQSTHPA